MGNHVILSNKHSSLPFIVLFIIIFCFLCWIKPHAGVGWKTRGFLVLNKTADSRTMLFSFWRFCLSGGTKLVPSDRCTFCHSLQKKKSQFCQLEYIPVYRFCFVISLIMCCVYIIQYDLRSHQTRHQKSANANYRLRALCGDDLPVIRSALRLN